MDSVTVRVPATSANLACGFDVLGCAWSLYNTLRFTPADALSFTGCDAEFQNTDNLAWQGYAALYRHLGQTPPPVRIDIAADIPVCRGLGSSAAMLVAGVMAANALSGAALSKPALLDIVNPLEGHPDNLAPALYGGLVASMMDGDRVYSHTLPVHPSLCFVLLYPDYTLPTSAARAALPKEIPFSDAVFNLSRLAMLPGALAAGDLPLISHCLDDRLHQPYRRPLIHGMDEVQSAAAALGCHAFCVSGAGPSLLCVTDDPTFADRLRHAVSPLPHHWTVRALPLDLDGAALLPLSS